MDDLERGNLPLFTGMARGRVLLDEHLWHLAEPLVGKNIRPHRLPSRTVDEDLAARGLLFITRDRGPEMKRVVREAEIGVIMLDDGADFPPDDAAEAISRAIIDLSLWSRTEPFIVRLHKGGSFDEET